MDAFRPESLPAEPRRRSRRKFWIVAASATVIAIATGIAYLSLVADDGSGRPDYEITAMLQPLADADKLTLFSFDGNEFLFASQKPSAEGEFYGCPVLGKIEIDDPHKRKAIVNAVQVGIRDARYVASCFWPHHAIRVEKDGQTVDYIICFYCSNFRKYSSGTVTDGGATTNAAEKLLNRYLTDAGIPIATK